MIAAAAIVDIAFLDGTILKIHPLLDSVLETFCI